MSDIRTEATAVHYQMALAEVEHLLPLSQLLNEYRITLDLPSDQPAVSHFLFERIINHDSVIFLALKAQAQEPFQTDAGLGFLQMYPSFSSQTLMPVWILGEVYVAPAHRRQGIATVLIQQALQLIAQRGDQGLQLEMSAANREAQALFKRMGFAKSSTMQPYSWTSPLK